MPATKPKRSASDLRQDRERAGLTRQELATASGCSMSMLGLLEAGYDPERSAARERIEAVLDELEREQAAA